MIENKCENRGQHCEDMRAAFEHRATWFYTLINEARKKGLQFWPAVVFTAITSTPKQMI